MPTLDELPCNIGTDVSRRACNLSQILKGMAATVSHAGCRLSKFAPTTMTCGIVSTK